MKPISTFLMAFLTTSAFSSEAQSPTCREDARVQYTDPADDRFGKATIGAKVTLGAIDADSAALKAVKDLKKTWAPHRTHWYIQTEPDTTRVGPWSTDIYIVARGESDRSLQIHIDGHISGGVKPKWINDKLLFVEVWWGRLGATDYILDIENKKWLYATDAYFVELRDQCE